MEIKYRVHEVAKDFDQPSKDIVSLLAKYFGETKKAQTALTDDELNVIFEYYTQNNQVESFDRYFAMANEKPEPKPEPKPAKKAAEKAAEKPAEKPAAKAEPAKEPAKAAAKPAAKKPAEKAAEKAAPAAPQKPKVNADPHPFQKREKAKDGAAQQSRTKGKARTIDTRTSNVDLDKYNEHYDQLAPENRNNDRVASNKQKLNQKSQQYRRQRGVRSRKRESEADRLKRIAAERAKKHIVVKIGDEISVGALAEQLRMTAAEVIKKMFT